MFVYCSACKYDSGERHTMEELASKVNKDGGEMKKADPPQHGWWVKCPNGHTDETRID